MSSRDFAAQFEAIGEALAQAQGLEPTAAEPPPPTRHVDCGTCRACCYMAVYLQPWDDASSYETDATGLLLAKKLDGSCVYLSEERGCTIHERRPTACRAFHCGVWYGHSTPEQREEWRARAAEIGNTQFDRMLAQGQARSLGSAQSAPAAQTRR